jgi:hypothetical protein
MTGDDDDPFAAGGAIEEDAARNPVEGDGSGSGYATKEGRRFAAIVHWRRHLMSLTGRRGVLELKSGPDDTATLTSKRGDVLFSVPIGEVRCRRSWPMCFTIECAGKRWRLWGIGVNTPKTAKRQLEITRRDHVLTIVPRPPGMSDQQYRKLMTNKLAQQRLWRELWLIALKAFGAQQV